MELRTFATVIVAVPALFLAGCGSVPLVRTSPEMSWVHQHGAAIPGADQRRAQRLCDNLCSGFSACELNVVILESSSLGGWSWPDGHIYLTSALVHVADDAELSAAIAHEMGHLVNNHKVHPPQALARGEEHLGIETAADVTGCRILASHGIAPVSMIDLLEMVRAKSSRAALRRALSQRISYLDHKIGSSPDKIRK